MLRAALWIRDGTGMKQDMLSAVQSTSLPHVQQFLGPLSFFNQDSDEFQGELCGSTAPI